MPCKPILFTGLQEGTLRTFGLDGGLELGGIVTEELRRLLHAAVARGLDFVTTDTHAHKGVSQAAGALKHMHVCLELVLAGI